MVSLCTRAHPLLAYLREKSNSDRRLMRDDPACDLNESWMTSEGCSTQWRHSDRWGEGRGKGKRAMGKHLTISDMLAVTSHTHTEGKLDTHTLLGSSEQAQPACRWPLFASSCVKGMQQLPRVPWLGRLDGVWSSRPALGCPSGVSDTQVFNSVLIAFPWNI